jgi:hypothetical protein
MDIMTPNGEFIRGERPVMDQSNGVTTDGAASTAGQRVGAPAGEQIRRELLSWPGVTDAPHRFGGVAFHLGRRELGHLHGDSLADFPFPMRLRDELVRAGRAQPHHVMPDSACVSYRIDDAQDLPGALALFRLAYERAVATRAQQDRRAAARMDVSKKA